MTGGAALQRFTTGVGIIGGWSTIAIGASIPISIAFDNLLLAAVLLAWMAGLQFREKLVLAWSNPVYRAALLLFAVLLLGTAYGQQAPGDAGLYLSKYLDLALVPMLGWAYIASPNRDRGLRLLAGALALFLLLSFMQKAGLIPPNSWLKGTADNPLVFKNRLTHNILMAFAVFMFAWLSCSAASRIAKFGWGTLSVLGLINITLMVDGATGYLLLVVLSLLFGWQRGKARGVAITVVSAIMVVTALSLIPGTFQARGQQIMGEMQQERADRPASTSTGYRMEFYRNTLALIQKNPVFGTGTGSFPAVYAGQIAGTGSVASKNPHNEFMLIAVQTGVIGLAAFLWLLWQQWRLAPQLPTPLERGLAQGLVLMMVMICMLNSALLDHTEGLLYAWLTALLYGGLESSKRVMSDG